jgi:hypothetical protein
VSGALSDRATCAATSSDLCEPNSHKTREPFAADQSKMAPLQFNSQGTAA